VLRKFLEKSPIGVSKRSCPVCHEILTEVYHYYNVEDVVSAGASHREIFPCSMPPGLPIQVMENHFRALLKAEFEKLGSGKSRESSNQSEPSSRTATTKESLIRGYAKEEARQKFNKSRRN
jgi:hypothetical protein